MQDGSERAVVFIDLAGFTALTEVHGDVAAADLVERFIALTRSALGPGDRLVKSIGDAVLLTSVDAASSIRLVARVMEACYEAEEFPLPRSGIHYGPVVERNGDIFGATVNLAARIAGRASGGQVLGTAEVSAAAKLIGIGVADIGPVVLRNIARPIALYEIDLRSRPADSRVDPLCRMLISNSAAAVQLRGDGAEQNFCSLRCADDFVAIRDQSIEDTQRIEIGK